MQSVEGKLRESHPAAAGPTLVVTPVFGVNEMRLTAREWLATIAIVVTVALFAPILWKNHEPIKAGADYRIPYALSKDYWLYERRINEAATGDRIVVVGDSVIWGEYVRPDGTLPHFLNAESGRSDRFVNGGVNGMFPLALEGLIRYYGGALHHRKVIVECNVLWMTSPTADLSEDKEQEINHSRLIPQFSPKIPTYHADANERLSSIIERNVEWFEWANHIQVAYYDPQGIPHWTLRDDDHNPPGYPNAWRNPLDPLKEPLQTEPAYDPLRGPGTYRHKNWNADGQATPGEFDWVPIDQSFQWAAFQRLISLLRERGDDVLVIIGPFNEHMIADGQRRTFEQLRGTIASRLRSGGVTVVVPETLPTELYADASHPLTNGYALLAKRIFSDQSFKTWLAQ